MVSTPSKPVFKPAANPWAGMGKFAKGKSKGKGKGSGKGRKSGKGGGS
jgi:hypothetical protein